MRRILTSIVAAASLIVLAGCADSPATWPHRAAPGGASLDQGTAGHHVTGSGHSTLGLTDDLREFTFHAIEHPNGSVSGSYKVERTDTGQYFIVDVSCLSVAGNTAFVGGHIVETNIATVVVGSVSYFWAQDNGEGGDPPDIVSVARINDRAGADVEFCTTHPLRLPPITVQMGNVQVR